MNAASPLLALRADASAAIGTGHVMRMLALAQAWRRTGGRAVFVAAEIPDGIRTRVEADGFSVLAIPVPDRPDLDATFTLEALARVDAQAGSVVAADGYHFPADFQTKLKGAGLRVLIVDDNGENGTYRCDAVLNQNVSARSALYRDRDAATRLLLGCDYSLIRSEFLTLAARPREIAARARRLLITFGGSDPGNVTSRAIDALGELDLEVTVVTGAGNRHTDDLRQKLAGSDFTFLTNASDMPALIAGADLALTAGGSTCWEMCLLGLPMIVTIIAENQRAIVRGLVERGAALAAGDSAGFDGNRLREIVAVVARDVSLRRGLSCAARSLVDGRGADRVVGVLHGLGGGSL